MLFLGGFFCFREKRTRDFAFVSLCYGRSGEEICMGYAMAASGRMQYDYKQTKSCRRHHPHATVDCTTSGDINDRVGTSGQNLQGGNWQRLEC